jgi:catechol 2,3-dioxygenase-like lactoylglutathione lyase family enzyme
MSVISVDHLNIRTPDFRQTLQFLQDALGMKALPLPQFDSMDSTAWVYDGNGRAVLHLASAEMRYSPAEILPDPTPRGTGAIHHVALACTDYDGMKARLARLNLEFRENVPEPGVRQIFVRDPSDIQFELNFKGD